MLYVIVTWDLVRERFVNSRFYCTVKHVLLCDNIRSYTFPKCCSLYWKVFSFISLEAVAKKLHVNLSKVIVYNCCPAVFSLGGISRRGMTKISLNPPLSGALQFVNVRLCSDANKGGLLNNPVVLEMESVW